MAVNGLYSNADVRKLDEITSAETSLARMLAFFSISRTSNISLSALFKLK